MRVHTGAAVVVSAAYAAAAFTCSGASAIAMIVLSEAVTVFLLALPRSGDSVLRWAKSLLPVLPVAVTVFAVNVFLGPGTSEVVSWTTPVFTVVIMREALGYGVSMALRLLGVVGAFSFLGLVADRDETMFFLSSPLSKSSLAIALSIRLVPYIASRITAVREAHGANTPARENEGIAGMVKAATPILRTAVCESLELALDLAEAMWARGWGAGPRSRYPGPRPGLGDAALCIASAAGFALFSHGGSPYWTSVAAAGIVPATCALWLVVVKCMR